MHESRFTFAGKADDNICADRHPGDAVADLGDKIPVLAIRVAAAHHLEHIVIASLEGHFDMRHDLGQGCHRINQFEAHPIRVGG